MNRSCVMPYYRSGVFNAVVNERGRTQQTRQQWCDITYSDLHSLAVITITGCMCRNTKMNINHQ